MVDAAHRDTHDRVVVIVCGLCLGGVANFVIAKRDVYRAGAAGP